MNSRGVDFDSSPDSGYLCIYMYIYIHVYIKTDNDEVAWK